MQASDLKILKERTKEDIREVMFGSGPFAHEAEEAVEKYVRICLYKLRLAKPGGKEAAAEVIEEMGLVSRGILTKQKGKR